MKHIIQELRSGHVFLHVPMKESKLFYSEKNGKGRSKEAEGQRWQIVLQA